MADGRLAGQEGGSNNIVQSSSAGSTSGRICRNMEVSGSRGCRRGGSVSVMTIPSKPSPSPPIPQKSEHIWPTSGQLRWFPAHFGSIPCPWWSIPGQVWPVPGHRIWPILDQLDDSGPGLVDSEFGGFCRTGTGGGLSTNGHQETTWLLSAPLFTTPSAALRRLAYRSGQDALASPRIDSVASRHADCSSESISGMASSSRTSRSWHGF